MERLSPLYASCHMCHSAPGEPCKGWALRAKGAAGYCDRRMAHAARIQAVITNDGYQGSEVDVAHGLAHGALCTDHGPGVCHGICTQCGQYIATLKNMEK